MIGKYKMRSGSSRCHCWNGCAEFRVRRTLHTHFHILFLEGCLWTRGIIHVIASDQVMQKNDFSYKFCTAEYYYKGPWPDGNTAMVVILAKWAFLLPISTVKSLGSRWWEIIWADVLLVGVLFLIWWWL